jgi:hypothetical protein
MTPDVLAALARVPSPVREAGDYCRACKAVWHWRDSERHTPDCWWPAFLAAREALVAEHAGLVAAGVTVEGVVGRVFQDDGEWVAGIDAPGGGRLARIHDKRVAQLLGRPVTVTIRPVGEATR